LIYRFANWQCRHDLSYKKVFAFALRKQVFGVTNSFGIGSFCAFGQVGFFVNGCGKEAVDVVNHTL
jgi:hypothetical protein